MSDLLDNMFIEGTGGFAPNGGLLPQPPLTRQELVVYPKMKAATPDSDILNDMFIEGTGGFAPNGGELPPPPRTYGRSFDLFLI